MSMVLYYHCDIWKGTDSMELQGVFDMSVLGEAVEEDYKAGAVVLLEPFENFEGKSIRELNDGIAYAYFEAVELNERL